MFMLTSGRCNVFIFGPLGSRLWCITVSCHFPIGILGQVWYLIVSIPDLCTLTYFVALCHFQLYNHYTEEEEVGCLAYFDLTMHM